MKTLTGGYGSDLGEGGAAWPFSQPVVMLDRSAALAVALDAARIQVRAARVNVLMVLGDALNMMPDVYTLLMA